MPQITYHFIFTVTINSACSAIPFGPVFTFWVANPEKGRKWPTILVKEGNRVILLITAGTFPVIFKNQIIKHHLRENRGEKKLSGRSHLLELIEA